MSLPPNAQWLRYAQVVVGKNGSGLAIDQLKIDFQVFKSAQATPNTALIKIFNLNPNNEKLIKNEYDEVTLNAGYVGNVRVLFRGSIKRVFKYRDGNDWVTEIEAADGDLDYRNAFMCETLASGTTTTQMLQRIVSSFKTTTLGHVNIPETSNVRGLVMLGNARDMLHDLAKDSLANWSIQDGELVMVQTNATLPNSVIVVNSNTGMLSAPEINDRGGSTGIGVSCLLNPDIKINGRIQLNNSDIKIREKKAGIFKKAQANKPTTVIRLDPDGIYKVLRIQHRGDNRDSEWVSEFLCIGLRQQIPVDNVASQNNGLEDQLAAVEDAGGLL